MKKLNYRTKAVIAALVLIIVLLICYLCGIFITEEMIEGSFLSAKQPPGRNHLFGTDGVGRDLFLRTLKGLSVSITIGITASLISAVIAVLAGTAAAMDVKWADGLMNWLIDLMMGIPHTILILLISFAFGRGMKGLMIGIAATHWCSLARVIRGEVLQLRSRHFVAVSRKLGKSGVWILMNHMVPHLIPQFLVGLVLMFPHVILHEASISFLGFGLPPEQAALGIILSESMRYFSNGMWWMAVLPGATLVLFVLLVDKLGDYLRVILDPYSAQE